MLHSNGDYIHVEKVGAFQKAINIKGVSEIHLVGILRNRTDEVSRQQMLEDALEAAQNLSQAKSRFLATVSHEIRTPVHGVQNLIQLASTFASNPQQSGYLDSAQSVIRVLSLALDSLVEYASLESSPKTLSLSKNNLRDLIENFVRYFHPLATEKGLSLQFEADPEIADYYWVDERKLGQIIMGLVGNAIKFTESGGVMVKLLLAKRESRPDQEGVLHDQLRLQVQDTGCGMNEQQQGALMGQDYSLFHDQDTLRQSVGLGLGMKFIKSCVEHLNAELSVQSDLGLGTQVEVEFAAEGRMADERPAQGSRHASQQSGPVQSGTRPVAIDTVKTILIVDDSELNRLVLRSGLEHL
ncbi:MAG: ATP-binding protein, partial [Limnobacter sp.]|nr:ATP-binding protein [Limnobacter sp.]